MIKMEYHFKINIQYYYTYNADWQRICCYIEMGPKDERFYCAPFCCKICYNNFCNINKVKNSAEIVNIRKGALLALKSIFLSGLCEELYNIQKLAQNCIDLFIIKIFQHFTSSSGLLYVSSLIHQHLWTFYSHAKIFGQYCFFGQNRYLNYLCKLNSLTVAVFGATVNYAIYLS